MAKREVSYDYFWNSKSDRYYSADSMGDWLRPFFCNGVFNGQLQVTANDDMSVTIAEGYGYINGKHRHFLTPTTLDLEVASGTLNRIDAVMLRRDDTERRISLLIVKGGNASTPTAPQPTRDGAIYELKLADIYIAAGTVKITQAEITDMRMNTDVCGWVAATVKEIDFSQMQNQFESYFANYKTEIADEFNEYLIEIERLKGEGKLSYDSMVEVLNNHTEQFQNIFTAWFDQMKDQLSEDAAGNLQLQIDDLHDAVIDLDNIEKAFRKVFFGEDYEESDTDPEAMTPGDISSALSMKWDGETSEDATAMNREDVDSAISTPWNGESSEDPEAMSPDDVKEATGVH